MAKLSRLCYIISFASVEISEEDQERWKADEMMRKACQTEEDKEAVKKYIESRSDINKRYSVTQDSLLHMAVVYGLPETVSLLIENSADVNQEDWCGLTPTYGVDD